jgi:zinc protease
MEAVTHEDAEGYHRRAWNAARARFTVVGAVTTDEVVAALEPRLGAPWKAGTAAAVELPDRAARVPDASGGTAPIVLVDKPGSSQTMFYLLFEGPGFGEPQAPEVKAGTIVLGGTFTSRLNTLLREERGYTYGARARVASLPGAGVRVIATRIRTDATADAMKDIVSELAKLREGVTEAEIAKARGAYRSELVELMETREDAALTFAPWHAAGLPPEALGAELAAVEALTPEAVRPAMAAYDPAKAVIVLVGDRAAIEQPLSEAGFGPFVVAEPL